MTYPIPVEAFDDRLAAFGTAGAGKTYLILGAMARLLKRSSRLVAIDPLGVMWGLRLMPDGTTPSPFKVVVFGGPHGDLPLNEHAGALIGETAATMAESCILDLSGLGTKAAERRFMLAFLTALYRHANKEPVHLIFDEADMWAPQKLLDKDGDAAKLLGMMETVVRRGRVRGFVPWLITQRPAVLSKDVLSQADGVVAMKLTSKQDRDAFEGWIEGQADRATGKDILAGLPTLERGSGYVWIPARGILKSAAFPENQTFDSSRTPKRGEKINKVTLKPLDLQKLQGRLAAVVEEQKANDPAALRAEIARLKAEMAKAPKPVAAPSREDIRKFKSTITAYRKALEAAMKLVVNITAANFFQAGGEGIDKKTLEEILQAVTERGTKMMAEKLESRAREMTRLREQSEKIVTAIKELLKDDTVTVDLTVAHQEPFRVEARPSVRATITPPVKVENGTLPGPQQRIINSLATWASMGHDYPTNAQVAWLARYSPGGGAYGNPRGALKQSGLIDYPGPDLVALTDEGRKHATPMELNGGLLDFVLAQLPGPEARILKAVANLYPEGGANDAVAAAAGYSAGGGAYGNPRGSLRTKGLITYPGVGMVRASDWLFA